MAVRESALESVYDSPSPGVESKTPTYIDRLAQAGLLAHRPLNDQPQGLEITDLRPRNQDRVRMLKRIAHAPSGLPIKTIVSEVVKGQPVGQCPRFDGSDKDYQFAYDVLTDYTDALLPEYDLPLIRSRTENGTKIFAPRTPLLDLISQGVTQTPSTADDILFDREFVKNILQHQQSLTDNQKQHIEKSLESYVSRIDDYALLFDVVCFDSDSHGSQTRTFTKPYKTRFNDQGRIAKAYTLFNQALRDQLEHAENAVLVTLTTDPGTFDDPTRPNPRPLQETIESINPNFNRLNSWLKGFPKHADDTREEGVPSWKPELDPGEYHYHTGQPTGGPPKGPVTSRPGEKLDYIKVLEYTEKGYPHLHVLFFDVPTRKKDGMPWLVDKAELQSKWKQYGQGQVVDLYPLVKRDDLDELPADFGTELVPDGDGGVIEKEKTEGFVDWYRYGDHDYSNEWIERQQRSHDQINFSDDNDDDAEAPLETTAGAYLGKYLSATFGALLDTSESLETNPETHEDKAATWKLGLYWATQRRFWSMSTRLRNRIKPNENLRESPEAADSVRWATKDTIKRLTRSEALDHYARTSSDLEDIEHLSDIATAASITPNVESTLPETTDFGTIINYRGAYAIWDLPTESLTAPTLDDTTESFGYANNLPEPPDLDRPPPITTVFH